MNTDSEKQQTGSEKQQTGSEKQQTGSENTQNLILEPRSLREWIRSTSFLVYCSHCLSTWGDRMWSFAVGLFLIEIAPESLQLTAIYGLISGGAQLLLGPLLGDWIDRTPRLRAARTALVVQNSSVILCAGVVCVFLQWHADISSMWGGWMVSLCHVIIISIAVVARLASVTLTISVERDWIVEICARDSNRLATMSAMLRRIDLGTKILAPIATGQIMTYASLVIGSIFIAGWNLASVFAEFFLLWKVYKSVPILAFKATPDDRQALDASDSDVISIIKTPENTEQTSQTDPDQLTIAEAATASEGQQICCKKLKGFFSGLFASIVLLYSGWRTYMKYDAAWAGLGLAFLYLTVLGFDNITVGFAYSEGLSESILGIVMAAGAIVGIIGTFIYPIIRRRVGLPRTGLFSFSLEIFFLGFCLASIWTPGSPFDPTFSKAEGYNVTGCTVVDPKPQNLSSYSNNTTSSGGFTEVRDDCEKKPHSNISIILLMVGIVTARLGLWMADLTVTQVLLESTPETERGVVNGVQNSLNKLMDMLKFSMVVAAPQPQVFGILILVSFFFICLGGVSFAYYSRRIRGHLFHFNKLTLCMDRANNNTNAILVAKRTHKTLDVSTV